MAFNFALASFRITGVNLKAAAGTSVTFVPAQSGRSFWPVALLHANRSVAGGSATDAVINLGVTAGSNYNDIFDNLAVAGYLSPYVRTVWVDNAADGAGKLVSLANPIKLYIATASGRTTETADFILQGYLY